VSAPLIEAISGLLMVGAIVWLGPWPGALVGFGLIALMGCVLIGLAVRRSQRATSSKRAQRSP
jgi:hypothetical protein